ncbi:hypothetical protein [uncultured Tolumonas sp.]|uniref:hypothetical protein n=1 Tax=uncultured Tolumonas sp. TaxID=263765 RepID=UPI002A0A954C|nr:hypothetical protein [uncultured Tolumonas sp.]
MTATVSKVTVLAEPPLQLGFAYVRDYGVLFQWQLVVLAQRMVRTLCPQCKQLYPIKASDRELYGFPVGVTQLCIKPLDVMSSILRVTKSEPVFMSCCWSMKRPRKPFITLIANRR